MTERTSAHDDRPSNRDVINLLREHPNGLTGAEVIRHFQGDERFSLRNIQRAVQGVLDSGQVELGNQLRLLLVKEYA